MLVCGDFARTLTAAVLVMIMVLVRILNCTGASIIHLLILYQAHDSNA